jgi:hypothetical protein
MHPRFHAVPNERIGDLILIFFNGNADSISQLRTGNDVKRAEFA